MKRIIYITIISLTVLFSFGFRGCDSYAFFVEAIYEYVAGINLQLDNESGGGVVFQIMVGEEGRILTSEGFGSAEWVERQSGTTEKLNFVKLWEDSPTTDAFSIGDAGTVLSTSDKGQNWANKSIPGLTKNLYGFDFFFLGGSVPGVVVCGQTGIISVSTDAGLSWTTSNTITTENLNSIIAIQKTLFIAVGDGGTIIKTYDQGQTWEDHTVGGANFNRIFDGGYVQAYGYLWAVGDNGRIFATTNYGISWFPQTSGVTDNLYDVKFRSADEGMVVGAGGVVRYTTDGGSSWLSDPYLEGLTDGDIYSLSVVNSDIATTVIRNVTESSGSGTLVLTVSSEPLLDVGDDDSSVPSKFSLGQNYPNPFNPITKINYTVPQFGLITIKVYDILGKEVATLVNEEKPAGIYNVEFNGFGLSSGVYYYTLSAGNYSETRKLVLLK
jgi:photosystem II stability/assembly factor-like uncharacterized protein